MQWPNQLSTVTSSEGVCLPANMTHRTAGWEMVVTRLVTLTVPVRMHGIFCRLPTCTPIISQYSDYAAYWKKNIHDTFCAVCYQGRDFIHETVLLQNTMHFNPIKLTLEFYLTIPRPQFQKKWHNAATTILYCWNYVLLSMNGVVVLNGHNSKMYVRNTYIIPKCM